MGRKFFEIDEEFICENCGKKIDCLHSKHVDINPGDRAETCHGVLEPIRVEPDSKKGYIIIFRCKKCGAIRRNKAAKDDNIDLLIKLTASQ